MAALKPQLVGGQLGKPKITNKDALKNLSQDTIDLINQSPTLVDQINNNPVSIEYGSAGGGTYIQGDRIVLDGNNQTNSVASAQSIAHEMGRKVGPAANNTNLDTYISSRLGSEGAATINNYRVRDEILTATNSKTDIGIAGNANNHPPYSKVMQDLQSGAINEATAQQQIGTIFGTNERPSTQPNIDYSTYYRNQGSRAGIPPAQSPSPFFGNR